MLMPAFLEDASFNQSPTFGDVDLFGEIGRAHV